MTLGTSSQATGWLRRSHQHHHPPRHDLDSYSLPAGLTQSRSYRRSAVLHERVAYAIVLTAMVPNF